MWINFLIPKIEDGNNFGVSIQVGVNNIPTALLNPFVSFLSWILLYDLNIKEAAYIGTVTYLQSCADFHVQPI